MLLKNPKQKTVNLDTIEEDGIYLVPVEPEDMWHAHNLIHPEDTLKAQAVRKVKLEGKGDSDIPDTKTATKRIHVQLTIRVLSTFFDPAVSSLRVSGVVVSENDWVGLGQHHTLDLELNRPFTLWKRYGWDSVSAETLRAALAQDKDGAVAAVVMQEGLANICLITEFRTISKLRIESSVPKKRSAATDQDSGMRRFFDKTLSNLLRTIDFAESRVLLLASPGFVAQDFKKYITSEGARKADKVLQRMAKDAVIVHSSSGHLHSLNEVLKSPEAAAIMKDKKYSRETGYVDELFDRIRKDDGRAWYGTKPVEKAVMEGAVGRGGGVLLVNNDLFRSMDVAIRRRYVALVDKVKEDGGQARVLSRDHESGIRLDALGGIAAILTYPMLDLDDDDDEEGDGPSEEGQFGATELPPGGNINAII